LSYIHRVRNQPQYSIPALEMQAALHARYDTAGIFKKP
jgi:hypothetical protein